jgi:hypothetical protein
MTQQRINGESDNVLGVHRVPQQGDDEKLEATQTLLEFSEGKQGGRRKSKRTKRRRVRKSKRTKRRRVRKSKRTKRKPNKRRRH